MFKGTHKIKNSLWLVAIFIQINTIIAQHTFPKNLFHSPVDSTVLLAGNFAELRTNHFHGGIDVKTGGQEGRNIYSIYDGYVSKIKIAHRGYGKMIYITHPNGYISVYAHLSKFAPKIDAYVRKYQYEKKTYEIELHPDSADLPVKTKELIALSGNTGGSTAPHLHFEIRDAQDNTYNPILFGFGIQDTIKPSLYDLAIFPINETSQINKKNERLILRCSGSKGTYSIKNYKNIQVSGPIGFGITSLDFLNNSSNRCGIYSIDLYIDNELYFSHVLDKIPHHETRYINTLVDYETWQRSGMKIQKCFIDPGNKLSTYRSVKNQGVIEFKDSKKHEIKIIVKDSHFNSSELAFSVSASLPVPVHQENKKNQGILFHHDKPNQLKEDECLISIPENKIYHDIYFEYQKQIPKTKNFLSNIHKIHDPIVPLHSSITLSIKTTKKVQNTGKLCIVRVEKDHYTYEAGTYENEFVTTTIKNFGNYAVMADTTAPNIGVLKLPSKKNHLAQFKIGDWLSGIHSYELYINGHYLLTEYEYKNSTLTYYPDEYFPKEHGEYELLLIVRDKLQNEREYKTRVTL